MTRALRVVLLLAVLLGLSLPASAATVDVQITQNGPSPRSRTIASGDRIRFVNSDSFPHSLRSRSTNWSFSTTLAPGDSFTTAVLTRPGDYTYEGFDFDTFTGDVRIPAAGPSPSPKPSATARPRPSPVASPTSVPTAVPPPGRPATPSPGPASATPGPVAPSPRGTSASASPGPAPVALGQPATSAPLAAFAQGPPPEPPTSRRLGLPAALAALAAAGVLSLLARALLAEPVA